MPSSFVNDVVDVRALIDKEIAKNFEERELECLKCKKRHKAWVRKELGRPLVVWAWCPFCVDYTLHRDPAVSAPPSVVQNYSQVVVAPHQRHVFRLREGYYIVRLRGHTLRLPHRLLKRLGFPVAVSLLWDDDLHSVVIRPATPQELEVVQVANERER